MEQIAECSLSTGRNELSIKVFRAGNAYLCERKQVERDGTESIQTLSFKTLATLRSFIENDCYYPEYAKRLNAITVTLGKRLNG